jgi:hypothetical protein
MKRREFITALGVAATWPFAARAQQAGRTYRLGALVGHPRDVPVNVAFLEEFRRRGFIEGQNLAVEWRAFGKDLDRVSQYAAELTSARVESSQPQEKKQLAQRSRRPRQFRLLRSQTICSGPALCNRWRGRRAIPRE